MKSTCPAAVLVVLLAASVATASAASLPLNSGFEAGLSSWEIHEAGLGWSATTNASFNRNGSAFLSGTADGQARDATIRQRIRARRGDTLRFSGFLKSPTTTGDDDQIGTFRAYLEGPFDKLREVALPLGHFDWTRFEVTASTFGISDGGFESGDFQAWHTGFDHARATLETRGAATGRGALRLSAEWSGWSFNQVYQELDLVKGEQVEISARLLAEVFQKGQGVPWIVAAVKLEPVVPPVPNHSPPELKIEAGIAALNSWYSRVARYQAPVSGTYALRCMLLGGVEGSSAISQAQVLFDDVDVRRVGAAVPPDEFDAYLVLKGTTRPTARPADVGVYVDGIALTGATAGRETVASGLAEYRARARALTTNDLAAAAASYPPLYMFGLPGAASPVVFPREAQVSFPGYEFRRFAAPPVSLRVTNTIEVSPLDGPSELVLQEVRFLAKNPHTTRGSELLLETNQAPYFRIHRDEVGPFGEGPFPREHTYLVGEAGTRFPARLSTEPGRWPRVLHIVTEVTAEALQTFTNALWNKHVVLRSATPDPVSRANKAARIILAAASSVTNLTLQSQELHLGAATESDAWGMIDYPNVTYQDHNAVGLRAPWIHNPIDHDGWYVQPVPRGSATIEPLSVEVLRSGSWLPGVYEEYLFNWDAAASSVRSLFDNDAAFRIPGRASYFVGLRVGHAWKNDAYGPTYPLLAELRGNSYFRLAPFDGAMAGSFRPILADPFGLHGAEDFPLMPEARLTLDNTGSIPAGSAPSTHLAVAALIQSKTTLSFAGAAAFALHGDPAKDGTGEVHLDADLQLNILRPVRPALDGGISIAGQSSMNWRAGDELHDGTEAHDVDQVVVFHRSSGDWITLNLANPPAGVRRQSLGGIEAGDRVYLLQTDRSRASYGFTPETPYERASHFAIELQALERGGTPLPAELFTFMENTSSEANDNVVVATTVTQALEAGDRVDARYRYRVFQGPGVRLLHPSHSPDHGRWDGRRYSIELVASDEMGSTMEAELAYGVGVDSGWKPMTARPVAIPADGRLVFAWDTSAIAPGAYHVRAIVRRTDGTPGTGFAVSPRRIPVGGMGLAASGAGSWTNPAARTLDLRGPGLLRVACTIESNVVETLRVSATDALGQSHEVQVPVQSAQYRIASAVDIPWAAFGGIDRGSVSSINVQGMPASRILGVHTLPVPLGASARFPAGAADETAKATFARGEAVGCLITLTNPGDVSVDARSVRLVHEYAADDEWLDLSHPGVPRRSYRHRRGDRLAGGPEQAVGAVTLSPGGALVITNIYANPAGREFRGAMALGNDPGPVFIRMIVADTDGMVLFDDHIASYEIRPDTDERHFSLRVHREASGALTIEVDTVRGRRYVLEQVDSLPAVTWSVVSEVLAESTHVRFDRLPVGAAEFLRVREVVP